MFSKPNRTVAASSEARRGVMLKVAMLSLATLGVVGLATTRLLYAQCVAPVNNYACYFPSQKDCLTPGPARTLSKGGKF